jgi:hypothetical protein
MKKIKIIGLYATILVSVVACKKDLDINRNPYLPSVATPKLLLPSGIAYSASKIGGDLQLIGAIWSQHYTQNNTSAQYKTIEQYSIGVPDYNSIWTSVYGGALKDLDLAKSMASQAGQWNYYVPASIMQVFDYHVLNDLYSQLPYSQGLQGDVNTAPMWEDGKVVNTKLIAQLDDAIAKSKDAAALAPIGLEDFLFQGDIAQWVKFAKTLKLKILMRDFTANQAAITALLNEGDLLDTKDAKMTAFVDSENKSNPLYEYDRRKLNTFFNIKASKTLLSVLTKNNDPRLPDFFEKTITGTYVGLLQGNFTITGPQTNETSRAVLAATDAVYFTSAAESKFLQSEAWARLGNAGQAKTTYDAGVTLAFGRWGKAAAAAPFIAAGGAYEFKAGATEAMVKQIITQKWLAAVRSQAWDSFFDQNRTGYPVISTVGGDDPAYVPGDYTISINTSLVAGEVPRRLLYPKISSDNNVNTPKAVPINTKMWWHKQ